MSTPVNALASRIAEDFAAATAAGGRGLDTRRRALRELQAAGLPGTRDENWKYANLRGLERLRFVPAPAGATAIAEGALPAALPGFSRQVFVDGRYAPALSGAAPGGVFAPLAVTAAPPGSLTLGPDQRFALLNEAFATDGALVRVPARASARLELIFLATAEAASGSSYPRLSVEVADGAHLELIERHVSAASLGSFVNGSAQLHLARGAQVRHYRLQELSARSRAFDTLGAALDQDASYRLHAIGVGGAASRSTVAVRLQGERAAVTLAQVLLGARQQVQDCFALFDHAAPRTQSEQLFRGIAASRARVAFNGKVVVAPGAAGADSRQSLRGLLAGPEAEIDVRPQLEIYTDAVRCSHGATTGKLDEQMLFYLLSRGLSRDTAQRLLKWAFLEDAVSGIELPELRRQVELALAAALEDETLKELL
ncbi:MAG: Fe-S cluster assembly protein SufD [Proteobacteria bacterium]|nr:Fe-S cluster assembly protein SufD [Pseudomonadota bacterium]